MIVFLEPEKKNKKSRSAVSDHWRPWRARRHTGGGEWRGCSGDRPAELHG